MKYVQLIEKRKGRIVKNEQYTVDEFMKLVFDKNTFKVEMINPKSFLAKIFRKTFIDINKTILNNSIKVFNTVKANIYNLIEKDIFVEYMYVSDLKEILSKTDAIFSSKKLEDKFLNYKIDLLLKTKYIVNSPVTYIEIEPAEDVLL